MRALHQAIDEDPKILLDPIAPRLIGAEEDRRWMAPLLEHPFAKGWRAGFALRARYAEDCLAASVRRGVTQYVILGAGLDTFAYRQPPWGSLLRIFELDQGMTQRWKRHKLQAAGIGTPSNVTFVPIDFERVSVGSGLMAAGFAFEAKTLCSWMGVTQYLSPSALDATLQFGLGLPRESEIVFSFVVPQEAVSGVEADALQVAARQAAEAGEPWLTRLRAEDLVAKLRAMGFSQVIPLTPEEARERYFSDRRDGLMERRGEQLMRAIV